MGIYLSSPKTEKVSEDGENDRLRYGLSSMQGWRSTMEDAHAVYPHLDTSTSFFGVYDGHGGDEVSKFCAKFLHREVLNHEAFSVGDVGTSMQHAFLRQQEGVILVSFSCSHQPGVLSQDRQLHIQVSLSLLI